MEKVRNSVTPKAEIACTCVHPVLSGGYVSVV